MNTGKSSEYNLFLSFIDYYIHKGFEGINRKDPLILQLEKMMEMNKQLFIISDMIQMRILFSNKLSTKMIGIEPDDTTPYHFFEATHPSDIQRHSMGRSVLFKAAQDIFISQNGVYLLSTNLKIRNQDGKYTNLLFQCYMFYSSMPHKTVYCLQINTDIEWYRKIRNGYHYFVGNDLSNFRYPDEKLLTIGNIYSDREFEILKLLDKGLSTQMIAQKLFLSNLTINTHRRNMLRKSGKSTIAELLHDLRLLGLI